MTGFSRCGMDNTRGNSCPAFQLHTGIDQIDDVSACQQIIMNTRGIRPAIGPDF